MLNMLIPSITIIILSILIMKLTMIISMKNKMNFEKMSPFECGFNPMNNSRMPFSMRFFLITIIFLIFDVEIALLIPMIYNMKLSNMKTWIITSTLFMIILLTGLMHEWNQGALNWL